MANITLANTDSDILDDLVTELAAVRNPAYAVLGTLTPDATGNHDENGTYGGQTAYTDATYHIWWSGGDSKWIISAVQGTKGTAYWQLATVAGAYAAQGTATGTATVAQGDLLFAKAEIVGSRPESKQKKFTEDTVACVIYESTTDHKIHDLKWGKVVHAELLLAAKGKTETLRKTKLTQLVNAAKNTINGNQPSDTEGFVAVGEELHRRIEWGDLSLEMSANLPWAIAFLPLRCAYTIATSTSH